MRNNTIEQINTFSYLGCPIAYRNEKKNYCQIVKNFPAKEKY
jgi:hypothetical protein